MADRENVITQLKIISTWASFARGHDLQFFTEKHLEDMEQWANDAIALLKQEAVEPKKEDDGKPEPWTVWWYVCGDCGQPIDKMDRFCRRCGKAVKWE